MTMQEILKAATVIPVLEVDQVHLAAPLAHALARGGLKVIELTLRTPAAIEALSAMKLAEPDLIIGMGTIFSRDDIAKSIDAGANFLVTPGADINLLNHLKLSKCAALPGVATASEAITASNYGFTAMKLFPAEAVGGVAWLRAISGPFPELVFCPTGGISAASAPEYLALPNVACVGGSWVAPKDLISAENWDEISTNASLCSHLII